MSPLAPCTAAIADGPRPARGLSLRRAIATALAVVTAAVLPGVLVAALAVEIDEDVGLSPVRLGIAVAAFWAAAAFGSVPAGRFVDRFGGGRGVHLAGGLGALASVLIAAWATYPVLVAALTLAGASLALATPGMSALVSRRLAPGRRGTVLGAQQSGPPLAVLLAGLALPLVVPSLGWRVPFVAAAALVLLATAAVRTEDCRIERAGGAGHEPRMVPLALAGGLGAGVASVAVAFLVPFATGEGIGKAGAGVLLAVASIAAIAVRMLLGVLADRSRGDPLAQMAVLLLTGALGFALLATAERPAIVAGALVALGIGWGWTGLFVLAAIEAHPEAPGAAVATALTGVYVGAVAGPLGGGFAAQHLSTTAVWAGCAVATAAGGGVLLSLRGGRGARA